MKPHPRIRKTIKWGGAAVTVLLVVVWIGSGWWSISAESPSGLLFSIGGGHVFYSASAGGEPGYVPDAGVHVFGNVSSWSFFPSCWYVGPIGDCAVNIPIWLPALVAAGISIVAWRMDSLARRRARQNLCPKCNYDRTGLVGGADAVCSECGASSAGPEGR